MGFKTAAINLLSLQVGIHGHYLKGVRPAAQGLAFVLFTQCSIFITFWPAGLKHSR
jgi:hypothetical protein